MKIELRDADAPFRDAVSREHTVDFVAFDVGANTYAMPTREIERIADLHDVVAIPLSPAYVLGVTLLDGQLVAVADLQGLLGETRERSDAQRLIVLRSSGFVVGVAVDRLHHLVSVPEAKVLPPVATADGAGNGLRVGLLPVGDNHIDIIDAPSIVHRLVGVEAKA